MNVTIEFTQDEYRAMMRALVIYQSNGAWFQALKEVSRLIDRLKPYEAIFQADEKESK